ncbi:hypothetical protein HH310_28440 [Actinoplanes sp. TBRC 11911]|uniref:hypothetical protein n=1 Tax=Actinoplanes sp. TBRC 11911 TaxID=2729386 RepID=UPI00145F6F81|nr:hypothetical protein [Actinoplanes sp. TBRC 11911]NMO55102.1 hypothetical protein [Actinoplanes sp. TBRC 11911]
MNKTVRMLALTGAAVAAGLSLGVAPASATPAATASASVQADHKSDDRRDDRRNDNRRDNDRKSDHRDQFKKHSQGYYRTLGACTKVGKVGKVHKKWVSFDCGKVRRGFHRNQWELTVTTFRRH